MTLRKTTRAKLRKDWLDYKKRGGMTWRESWIVEKTIQGWLIKEMADYLDCSTCTVIQHRSRAIEKMGQVND